MSISVLLYAGRAVRKGRATPVSKNSFVMSLIFYEISTSDQGYLSRYKIRLFYHLGKNPLALLYDHPYGISAVWWRGREGNCTTWWHWSANPRAVKTPLKQCDFCTFALESNLLSKQSSEISSLNPFSSSIRPRSEGGKSEVRGSVHKTLTAFWIYTRGPLYSKRSGIGLTMSRWRWKTRVVVASVKLKTDCWGPLRF